ncbi:hypothetical protein [Nocardia noduli]|uniref:hypothetical protein n=1 Tax=Nocardia noduli TaxID=2815722 RepID=UPI001C212733|nr:hypothetical protein [Nocardia noduli]
MTDSVERNLDSIARRLAEAHRAADAALAETPQIASLPVSAAGMSYAQLTEFNDDLRDRAAWTEIDLEAALSEEHRQALDNWRNRARIPWTTRDLAMVGVAGLVGATAVWFDSAIDQQITDSFKGLAESKRVRRWEAAGKRLPIDFMGKGFGGRAHRVKSSGHDLFRLFTTLQQVADGQFEGARWEFGQRIPVQKSGQFADVDGVVDAAMRIMQHLAADFLTPMSLPVPGMSWLYNSHNEAVKDFALHAYSGLHPGHGWNLRNATIVPGLTAILTEVIIRTHTATETYRFDNSSDQTSPPLEQKRTELLLAAHTLVGAISTGKAVAQLLAVKNERGAFHPAAIRHVQFPSLLRAGKLAIDVVDQASRASVYEVHTWDELDIDPYSVQHLDLSSQLESLAETKAAP